LFLANTSGAIALFVWSVISVSQLILLRRKGATPAGHPRGRSDDVEASGAADAEARSEDAPAGIGPGL